MLRVTGSGCGCFLLLWPPPSSEWEPFSNLLEIYLQANRSCSHAVENKPSSGRNGNGSKDLLPTGDYDKTRIQRNDLGGTPSPGGKRDKACPSLSSHRSQSVSAIGFDCDSDFSNGHLLKPIWHQGGIPLGGQPKEARN